MLVSVRIVLQFTIFCGFAYDTNISKGRMDGIKFIEKRDLKFNGWQIRGPNILLHKINKIAD